MNVIRSGLLAMLAVTVAGCAGEQGDSNSHADRDSAVMDAQVEQAARTLNETADDLAGQGAASVEQVLQDGEEALDAAQSAAGQIAEEELEELSERVQEEREQLEKDLARQMRRE